MRKAYLFTVAMLLLQVSSLAFGQESVKLFNSTGNEEVFSEAYYYDESLDKINYNFQSSDGSLYWGSRLDIDPTMKYSTTVVKQERQFTNNLGEFLTHKDSVQIQATLADKYSPVWILLFLKEELEARGMTADYPAQGKQPADYLVEISSCQWHCQLSSLRVKKRRYTGNYRIEYEVKWKEKDAKGTASTESETREQMSCEWEHKHKAEMDEVPNLSVTLEKLCRRIAKDKAGQIASALKSKEK